VNLKVKNELQEKEDEKLNMWRVNVNEERKQFKKSHHQMNFDEYQKATEKSNEKIAKLIAYLNENKNQWKIEFDKIKPEVLDANKQLFIDWWIKKVGNLPVSNKFMLEFRVDGDWKTVPLNQDTYKQLLEKLKNGSFVYNMEEMPTWEYEAGEAITELPQWSLFDAILIKPVKNHSLTSFFVIFEYQFLRTNSN